MSQLSMRACGPRTARFVDIVADADRAPHVVDGVAVAGIIGGDALLDLRPHIDEVRQLGFVERKEYARLDLPLEEIGARHDDVVAGTAGEQLRLERVVGVEDVVADLDSGLAGEVLEHGRLNVVRPVIDIDDPLLRRDLRRRQSKRGERKQRTGQSGFE
jgi:hypothetical protein